MGEGFGSRQGRYSEGGLIVPEIYHTHFSTVPSVQYSVHTKPAGVSFYV